MIEKITSLQNKKVKDAIKLKTSKGRKEAGLFMVEGFHLFEMAKKSNKLVAVFTNKVLDLDEKITQYVVEDYILDKLSFMPSNQGVISIIKMLDEKFDENLSTSIFIDNVSDPGNLGTILRTALAFDVKNVLISSGSVSIYNDKVLMASQGAIFDLNIKTLGVEDLEMLKTTHTIISSTLNDRSVRLEELKIPNHEKIILVFGNESRGVSDEVLKISDHFIKIPIKNIDSLNVGVAAGIIINYYSKL